MPKSEKPVAIVTGGSRGVGEATAKLLASKGWNVTITCTSTIEDANKVVEDCKKLGVEGLGVGKGIKTIKKFKPSRIRPRHTRGKDFPDLADDPTIGGVKAYADMPSIKARASKEAMDVKHMWGFSSKSVSELAPELHAGRKNYGRIYSKPGSKAYKRLIKKKK